MGIQLKAHQPCPDCGSSDALAVYDWGTKCYVREVVHVNDKNLGEHKRRNMTVVSEFLGLLDDYSPQFVLLTMNQMIQERSENTLSSVN